MRIYAIAPRAKWHGIFFSQASVNRPINDRGASKRSKRYRSPLLSAPLASAAEARSWRSRAIGGRRGLLDTSTVMLGASWHGAHRR